MFMFGEKAKKDPKTEKEGTLKLAKQGAIFIACFVIARGICNFNWSTYQ